MPSSRRKAWQSSVEGSKLSAGTAIATFALERLPEDVKVDSVVFLSSSLASRYPMTRALRRVKHGLYVFYSPDDAILKTFVPYTGTADRGLSVHQKELLSAA